MNREEFLDKLDDFDFDSFGKDDNFDNSDVFEVVRFFANKIYNDFEKQFEKEQNANLENEIAKSIIIEGLRKENTRLKKQLANNHHVECSCSFCKPAEKEALREFKFISCDDCKNKIDGIFQEVCSNCKRFYGCYFEKKEM